MVSKSVEQLLEQMDGVWADLESPGGVMGCKHKAAKILATSPNQLVTFSIKAIFGKQHEL